MILFDFLTCSLELLTLLERIERRQTVLANAVAHIEAMDDDNSTQGALLRRLPQLDREIRADIDRAIDLITTF